jgi:hypothetical protein
VIRRDATAILALVGLFGIAPVVRASDGPGASSYHFLNLGTSARVEAVGRLSTTFSAGADALEGNPARIGRAPRQLSATGFTWLDGVTAGYFAGTYSPFERASLAFGVRSLAIDAFDNVSDDDPVAQDDLSVALGASVEVTPSLDAGLAARFIQSELASRTASGWSVDAGLDYRWVEGWHLVGAARNLGPAFGYEDGPDEQLPTQASFGATGRLGELQFGVEGTWENGPGWFGGLGFELPVRDRLRLRAGSRLGEGSSNAVDPWAVGFGVVARPGLEIDYAFRDTVFDGSHRLGLRWTMSAPGDADARPDPRSSREFYVDTALRAIDDALADFPRSFADTIAVRPIGEHRANEVLTEVIVERLRSLGLNVVDKDPAQEIPADLTDEARETLEAAGVATESHFALLEYQVQESSYDVVGKKRERWIGPRSVRRTSIVELALRLSPEGAEEPTWRSSGRATDTEIASSRIPSSPGYPQAKGTGQSGRKNPLAEPAIVGGIVAGLAIIFFSNRDVGN